MERGYLSATKDRLDLSSDGRHFMTALGIDCDTLEKGRSRLCRECLDWSERKLHLAGAVGRELLNLILAQGWGSRETGTRIIRFDKQGRDKFDKMFPVTQKF